MKALCFFFITIHLNTVDVISSYFYPLNIHLIFLGSELFTREGFQWNFCLIEGRGKRRFLLRENSFCPCFRITGIMRKKKNCWNWAKLFPVLQVLHVLWHKNKNMFGLKHVASRWRAPVLSRRVIKNSAGSYRSTGVRSDRPKVLILSFFYPLPSVIHYRSADCRYVSNVSLHVVHRDFLLNTCDPPREVDFPSAAGDPAQRRRRAVGGGGQQRLQSAHETQRFWGKLPLSESCRDLFIYLSSQFSTMWSRWLQSEHLGSSFFYF